jgi:hypothetical protein
MKIFLYDPTFLVKGNGLQLCEETLHSPCQKKMDNKGSKKL